MKGLKIEDQAYLEWAHQRFVNTHHSSGIVKFPAVIGRRKQSDKLPFGEKFVAVFHDLVGAAYEVEIVPVQEFADDVSTEGERDAAVVLAPTLHVFVGIRPEQVT